METNSEMNNLNLCSVHDRRYRCNRSKDSSQIRANICSISAIFSCHRNRNRSRPNLSCYIVVLLWCLCSVSAEPTWRERPQNTSVALGESFVRLRCGVDGLGDSRSIIWQMYEESGAATILFIDDKYFASDTWPEKDRYSVAPHPVLFNGLGYDLTITDVSRYDDRTFECQVQQSSLDGKAKITVLVTPGTPVIATNQSLAADLFEGDYLLVTCFSDGGNPTPDVTLRRDDDVLENVIVTPPDAKFGTIRADVTLLLTPDDHDAVITCDAGNQAGDAPTTRITLNVKFAPRISFRHDNPLVVLDGQNTVLDCSVVANPDVNASDVYWSYEGAPLPDGTGFMYPLNDVSTAVAGRYSCTAANDINTAAEDLILDVQYGPRVSVVSNQQMTGKTIEVTESDFLNLTCNVESNPEVPSEQIKWTRDGTIVRFGASYIINSVQRSHIGNYVCEAENTVSPSGGQPEKRTGSDSVQVQVKYRPGPASITLPSSAIKGEYAELTCAIADPGYPAATLTWTLIGSSVSIAQGPRLSFSPLLLEDTNDYVCTPRNDIGPGQAATQELVVNEYPELITPVLPEFKSTEIEDRDTLVPCSARGKPSPTIVWRKDGQPIDVTQEYFTVEEEKSAIDTHSWNVTSLLVWRGKMRSPNDDSLRPQDRGNYSCHVTNDISQSQLSKYLDFVVHYPPILNTTSEKVAIDTNQSAIFECGALSVPHPTFHWYNGSTELASGGRITIATSSVPGGMYHTSTLTIDDVAAEDLGNYTCEGKNYLGSGSMYMELTVKTVPDSPISLSVLSWTWESAEVAWLPGFDGGYRQSFIVVYQSPDAQGASVDVGDVMRFNVTGLFPSSNYTFWVYAENLLGLGSYSNPATAYTQAFSIAPPTGVLYDPSSRTLSFESPSTNYCARVELRNTEGGGDGTGGWRLYEACAPTAGGSVRIHDDEGEVMAVQVALCLERRNEICSPNVTAVIEDTDDLPTSTIIIVAVVCGAVVVALTIVLIVLCCKRRASLKYGEEPTKRTQPAQLPPTSNGEVKQPVRGFDNPAVDGRDNIDFDDPTTGGVFATNTSANQQNGNYDPYLQRTPSSRQSNGYGPPNRGYAPPPQRNNTNEGPPPQRNNINEGPAPPRNNNEGLPPPRYNSASEGPARNNNTGGDNNGPPPAYDEYPPTPPARQPILHNNENPYVAMNRKKGIVYLDDPYAPTHPTPHELSKEGSSGDSGVSTPDPSIKPRKVIHEVIV